ncbi:MAG: right-handed parallel beta-helix repeat-containing protein [Candidatus Omnitrophota bacterium]
MSSYTAPSSAAAAMSLNASLGYARNMFQTLLSKSRKADNNPDTEIIGVTGFDFSEHTIKASDLSTPIWDGLTETVDSSSYPDRAIISLTNALGYDAYITNFIIDGQPIRRYKGALVSDRLRRDDDIRRNGESLFELGNEYVITATQVDRLADYWFKNLGKKKHLYAVEVKGFAPWYSPGDWYTLTVGSAGTNENIASTVECYDVQCSRSAGDIGSTTLLLREVEENWTKTTFYAARAVTSGSPKRRSQQSNTLIVAASTFDGTYDYKCGGTADDVEIQAAIDYVYYTFGGGEVGLTEGTYYITTQVNLYSHCTLRGAGSGATLLERDGDIYCVSAVGSGAGTEIDRCRLIAIGINNKALNTYTKPLVRYSYVSAFMIDSCKVYGAYGNGVQVQFGVGGLIKDTIVDTCAQRTSTFVSHGIMIMDSSATIISKCTLSNNGYSGAGGTVAGSGCLLATVAGGTVENCITTGNQFSGIAIGDGSQCRVSNCYCEGNAVYGIFMGYFASSISTNGNIIGNQVLTNGAHGICCYGNSNIFSGNICDSNTGDGITFINACDNNIVAGNTITNNGAYGIHIGNAASNNNVLAGNRATGNTTANLLDGGTATTDSGNDWT